MSSKLLSVLVFLLSRGDAQAVCATGQYEVPSCAVHDNWRKAHLGAHVEISLGSINYGGITSDWMTCLRSCHNSPACLQVVWVKSTRRCYGMSATSAVDQDGSGGSNVNYISAICNKAFDWERFTPGIPWQQGVLGHANTLYDWGNGATSLASISEDSSAVGVRFKLSSPGQIMVGLTSEMDQAAILSQGAGIEYLMYASTYHQQNVFVGPRANPHTSFSWANGDSFEIRLDATRAVVQFFQNDVLKSTMRRTSFPLKLAVSMGRGSVYDLSWVQATALPKYVERTSGLCTDTLGCQYVNTWAECQNASAALGWDATVTSRAGAYAKGTELNGCFYQSNHALRVNTAGSTTVQCSTNKCACACEASTTTSLNCVPLTACIDGQYEVQGPTQFSDRKCKPFPECADGEYFDAQATEATGRTCKPITLCTADQQYESDAPTKISDRKCKPFPECADGEYFDAQATEAIGRTCKPITLCAVEQQYESDAPTKISDRTCKPFPECADGQYFDAWATETTGRICKLTTVCTGDAQKELEAPTKTSDRKCGSRHDADYPNTCWFIEKNSELGTGDKNGAIKNDWSSAIKFGSSSTDTWTTARCRRFRGFSTRGKAELLCGSIGREGDPQVCSRSVCYDKCKSIGTDGCCQYIKPKARRLSLADARLSTLV